MRKLIFIILSVISFLTFILTCSYSDFWYAVKDVVSPLNYVLMFYCCTSVVFGMGFAYKAYGIPFSHWMLSGNRENSTSVSSYNEIERFMRYRNGLMGGMSPDNAARLMMDTAVADAIINGTYSGNNTKYTAKYINSRLGGLSPENQVKYLKGLKL